LRYLLFDLDETLYPREAGILLAIRHKIREFIAAELEMDSERAESLRLHYLKKYGTSMQGLILDHKIDPEAYLTYVHQIDVAGRIRTDGDLRRFLEKVDARRVIFTNATAEHANRVLDVLGVTDRFDRVIDIRDVDFVGKPAETAYLKALEILGVPGNRCLIADDSMRNLVPAARLGMKTALVNGDGGETADIVVSRVTELEGPLGRMGWLHKDS
jgi:putative hydrolase of the HAD superfamily